LGLRVLVMKPHRRAGLTLIELLVVLTILSVLTAVAVTATANLVEQSRFETTQRNLQEVQQVVVGRPGQIDADGTQLISGFVADVGRPPLLLAELWTVPALPAQVFQIRAAPAPDQDVTLACGWRGPYLRLPIGATTVKDGWGNNLIATNNAVTGFLETLTSLGADNAGGAAAGGTYDPDHSIALLPYAASITGSVRVLDTSVMPATLRDPKPSEGKIVVKFFYPDAGTAGGVGVIVREIDLSGSATPTVPTPVTFTFPDSLVPPEVLKVTMGPRVIRATQGDPTIIHRSPAIRLMLPPGGQAKDLVMQ
jgi:prepilin-type N-terminal cleavage/methylation domain-containing protein